MRARASGSKVYVVQYAIGEKTRRMSLGKVELQGLEFISRRPLDGVEVLRPRREILHRDSSG